MRKGKVYFLIGNGFLVLEVIAFILALKFSSPVAWATAKSLSTYAVTFLILGLIELKYEYFKNDK
ncbi:MAG: hypothetical protein AABY22_09895 [Nanoarchaeota archaeon]